VSERPTVTVVIPTLNEAENLPGCLAALARQSYPNHATEVLVIDGGSTDDTVVVARSALAGRGYRRWRVIANAPGDRSSNLNRGLAEATGQFVCRVDARSRVGADHIDRCVTTLSTRPDVRVVGGSQIGVVEGSVTAMATGIARALNNRWATGFARYRRGGASGPVDTVYLGAFRTSELRETGGWSGLNVNEDFELNQRLGRDGLVWFDQALQVGYVPRKTWGSLFLQYRAFGQAKSRLWRGGAQRPLMRQWVLLIGPPLAATAALGLLLTLSGAFQVLLVGGAVAGALAVEALGASRPKASARSHVCAVAALAAVSVGWLLGVVGGLFGAGTRTSPPKQGKVSALHAAGN
jgi:succinoglycan biosynthesis protein ExoA